MNSSAIITGVAAVILSGCSVAGGSGNSPSTTIAAGSAAATNYNASQVLSAYTQTFAKAGGPDLSAALATGIQGFGVGAAPAATAAAATNFRTAIIKREADTLTINVEGKEINLKHFQTTPLTVGGKEYTGYYFTQDGEEFDTGDKKDVGFQLQGQYSALTGYIKNSNVDSLKHTGDGYSILTSGLETETANLPSQSATYKGNWFLVANEGYGDGDFVAVANFNTGDLTWSATSLNGTFQSGSGTATIVGNGFTGTTSLTVGQNSGSADIVGKFYGVSAEEIAGVISGTAGNQQVGGGFIGNQQ